MADTDKALIIFIKNPRLGNVKTRLAATVGNQEALRIYRQLLSYTRRAALGVSAYRELWYSRHIPEGDDWRETDFTKKLQHGSSLGERMKHAFHIAFDEGRRRVVIIGSDCAQLQPEHIQEAFENLNDHEVVIGPANDGGYYLLGTSQFIPALFENKAWSTNRVMEQTLQDCKELNLSYHMLEELNDVDTEADWQQVKDKF